MGAGGTEGSRLSGGLDWFCSGAEAVIENESADMSNFAAGWGAKAVSGNGSAANDELKLDLGLGLGTDGTNGKGSTKEGAAVLSGGKGKRRTE